MGSSIWAGCPCGLSLFTNVQTVKNRSDRLRELALAARGSHDAGITQPRTNLFVSVVSEEEDEGVSSLRSVLTLFVGGHQGRFGG